MAEKFGLNGEVKELKIGRTFEKNSPGASAFHTVRYDFKPASVDSSREGVLTVDENKSVSITVPHPDGSGQTNFSGRVKNANPKECILIIDRDTGEITIETLSSQILVKKTRPERNPDPPALGSLTPTSASSTPAASSANSSRSQMASERAKPLPAKPSHPKPPQPRAPSHEVLRPSSPMFMGLPTQSEMVLPTMSSHEQQKKTSASSAAVLSESSSSSDSSSDDSSSSDSGSDNEDDKTIPAPAAMSMPSFMSGGSTGTSANPPPSMPSFGSLSPSKPTGPLQGRMSAAPPPQRPTAPPPARSAAPPPPRAPSTVMSMPQFLNDDLQLSDDSD